MADIMTVKDLIIMLERTESPDKPVIMEMITNDHATETSYTIDQVSNGGGFVRLQSKD